MTEACPSTIPYPAFTDVAGLSFEAYDAVACVAHYDVARGVSSFSFDPNGSVLRWQMALFLVRTARAIGMTLPNGSAQGFSDLGGVGEEARLAINQLAQLGIAKGVSPTVYDPNGSVTRSQMALFLTRLLTQAGVSLPSGTAYGFVDLGGLEANTQTAVNQLARLGIAKGISANSFGPYGEVLRRQMALFLARTLEVGKAKPFRVGVAVSRSAAITTDSLTVTVTVTNPAGTTAVANVPVDVFVAGGLTSGGECVYDNDASLNRGDGGTSFNCQLEAGDSRTDLFGRVVLTLQHTSVVEKDFVYAWTGEIGETFDTDTTRTYGVATVDWVQPDALTMDDEVGRYNTTVEVDAQLLAAGKKLAIQGEHVYFRVMRGATEVQAGAVVTGSDGIARLGYRGPSDPSGGDDLGPVDQVAAFWDADRDGIQDAGETAATATVTWDDALPVQHRAELTQATAGTLLNTYHPVTLNVTDKFGAGITNARVVFKVTGPTPVQQIGTSGSGGSVTFSYRSAVQGADTIDAQVDFDRDGVIEAEDLDFVQVDDLRHYWVASASSLLDGIHEFDVIAVNPGANTIDAYDLGTAKYLRLTYDTMGDLFSVDGLADRTLTQFEKALTDLDGALDLPVFDGVGGVGLSTVFYNAVRSQPSSFRLETG